MASEKTPVIERLYEDFLLGTLSPDGIVRHDDIFRVIQQTGARLKTGNLANFLKDIIRNTSANLNWPNSLTARRITARQRYGDTRVFEFVPFSQEQLVPFPDNFIPGGNVPVHYVQSATIPFAARQLGRSEESWLMQVAVNLRLFETHICLYSPIRFSLRDITHLQMSMKTQPEIDALFLLDYHDAQQHVPAQRLHALATCEAKHFGQRILEDQIREQVKMAFKTTESLAEPFIGAVKPFALQVRDAQTPTGPTRAVYIVEFDFISRAHYNNNFNPNFVPDTHIYNLPLIPCSHALYVPIPYVSGVNA